MCDVMMLALWVWAVIFWLQAMDSGKPLHFVASSVLIAACALTKYFGASLILLLPAYSLLKQRRAGTWVWYLLIPVAALAGYQFWTKALYGRGLLWDAAQYARSPEHVDQASRLTSGLVGLSFLGGCALPILLFAPSLWNRRQLILGSLAGALAGFAVGKHWLLPLIHNPEQHWIWIGAQFGVYVAGGISVLGLAIADYRKHYRGQGDADSALLALWILGTFLFAAFLNWTVNARSLLPLIPAAAILLARRLHDVQIASARWPSGIWTSGIWIAKFAIPLALSAAISLSIAWGDTGLRQLRTQHGQLDSSANSEPGRQRFVRGTLGVPVLHATVRSASGGIRQVRLPNRRPGCDPGKHHQHVPHRTAICGFTTNFADRSSRPRRHHGTRRWILFLGLGAAAF